jgi:diguanylate cyclase (GGDEF)-like protein
VLNTAGLRFQSVLRPTDIAFRAGGDEFILVLPKLKRLSDIRRLASRIQQTISEPIVLENGTIFLTISCGIARFPKQATSARELIAKADDALYLAKEKGRNTIVLNKSVLVPKN